MFDWLPSSVSQLWETVARGDWVIAFGLLTSLLTRLFAAGPLRQRIPKGWLRWIAVVLGVLTQSSAALAGGASWGKAVVLGLTAGLAAIGSWEAVLKHAPKIKKPTGLSVIILPLFFVLTLPGCAKDFPGKVSQTSTAVAAFRQVSREAYQFKCMKAVDECKAKAKAALEACKTSSCPTEMPPLESCEIWKKCDTQRERIFWSASTTQMMLDTSLVLWQMGKPEDAKAMFARAAVAFENLKEKITKYKLLEVLQ